MHVQACVLTEPGLGGGGRGSEPVCAGQEQDVWTFKACSDPLPPPGTSCQLSVCRLACSSFFPDYESKKRNFLRGDALENTGKYGEEMGSGHLRGHLLGGSALTQVSELPALRLEEPYPGDELRPAFPSNPGIFFWSLVFNGCLTVQWARPSSRRQCQGA